MDIKRLSVKTDDVVRPQSAQLICVCLPHVVQAGTGVSAMWKAHSGNWRKLISNSFMHERRWVGNSVKEVIPLPNHAFDTPYAHYLYLWKCRVLHQFWPHVANQKLLFKFLIIARIHNHSQFNFHVNINLSQFKTEFHSMHNAMCAICNRNHDPYCSRCLWGVSGKVRCELEGRCELNGWVQLSDEWLRATIAMWDSQSSH